MRLRFFSREEQSVLGVSFGHRVSIDMLLWVTPAVEWARYGYDCIFRYWAVYPLFEVEVVTKEFDEWAEAAGAKRRLPVFELTIWRWTWRV